MASDILIVDDEADIRELVAGILSDEGHGTRTARDSRQRACRRSPTGGRRWSSSTSGCRAAGMDGLALLDAIKREHADLPVVMISGHGNIETAVSAIKRGAYDYIEKPFKADRLMLVSPSGRWRPRSSRARSRTCASGQATPASWSASRRR